MLGISLVMASASQMFGIEGLTISIQNRTNVVLGWPSAEGETYIIQSRPALDANNPWQTLTDYYPAFSGTNWTTYVITNVIVPAISGADSMSATSETTSVATVDWFQQLDKGDVLVPPLPWLPASLPNGAILKASGEYVPLTPVYNTSQQATGDFASPDDVTNSAPPDPGFYEVVRDGAHPFGLTNGAMLSGEVQFPIEFALDTPDEIVGVVFYDENTNYLGSFLDFADTNGVISFNWDLTDGQGDTFDSTNFYGVFTVDLTGWPRPLTSDSTNVYGVSTVDTSSLSSMSQSAAANSSSYNSPNFSALSLPWKTLGGNITANGAQPEGGSSSSASATNFWVWENYWTPNNNWVVAYGPINQYQSQNNADTFMICGGPAGEYGGVLGTLGRYGLKGILSPGNSAQAGTVFNVGNQTGASNLLSYLV